jgi:hypothetical protein
LTGGGMLKEERSTVCVQLARAYVFCVLSSSVCGSCRFRQTLKTIVCVYV